MSWLISLSVALVSGLCGLFLGGFIANSCVTWYHIPSREGASGYFVVFIGLASGLTACILGLIVSLLIAWYVGTGFFIELVGSLSVVLVMAGLSAWVCRSMADVPPTIDGRELLLEVEFRFPANVSSQQPPTQAGDWRFTFASLSRRAHRKQCYGTIQSAASRFEDGRWIVPTQVELFTERGKRCVTLALRDATEVMGFVLPLPARPTREFEQWSEWLPRHDSQRQPWPTDKMSCRFRIVRT